MLKENDQVCLTKVHGKNNEEIGPSYTVKGSLIADVEVGARLKVFRTERNGVKVDGLFTSSPVELITVVEGKGYYVHTENSTWRVELLGERKEE